MCYAGSPILLADVLTWPRRSIIKQSYDARERLLDPTLPSHLGHGNLNGDGFGIGWYGDPSESGYHVSAAHYVARMNCRSMGEALPNAPPLLPPTEHDQQIDRDAIFLLYLRAWMPRIDTGFTSLCRAALPVSSHQSPPLGTT